MGAKLGDFQVCRVCLENKNSTFNSENKRHQRFYTSLTGIKVTKGNNGLPFRLCVYCAAMIRNFIAFRRRCLLSDTILSKAIVDWKHSPSNEFNWMSVEKEKEANIFKVLTFSKVSVVDNIACAGYNNYRPYSECSMLDVALVKVEGDSHSQDEIHLTNAPEDDANCAYDDYRPPDSPAMAERSDDSDSKPLSLQKFSVSAKPKRSKTAKKRKKPKHGKREINGDAVANRTNRAELDDLLRNVRIVTDKYTITTLTREEVLLEMADRFGKLTALYKCVSCVRGFKYEDVYRKHMAKHEKKPDHLECDICHQFLPSAILMRIHSKGHFLKYRCNACKKVCGSAFLLKEHYLQKHEAEEKSLTCHICGKILMRMSSYTTHLKRHTDASNVSCDTCGETFKSMDILRSHRLSMHSEERPYKCQECPKAFRYSGALSTHKQTHRKTRDFYCVECDIAFKTWHCLKVHLEKTNKHATPETLKHACPECDKRFGCSRLLNHHISWYHQGKKLHPCPHCPKAYGSYEGLRKHVKVIHEGVLGDFKYICEYCAKPFRVKAVWRSHVRIHTGERPYSCETCGRRFTQKVAMDTHIKLVHLKLKRNVKRKKSEQQNDQTSIPENAT